MIVFNPLSLYTTFLGWQQYDLIYRVLWETGILFFGFIGIVFRYFKHLAAPSGATHHAADHAVNHFLYELLSAFLVCSLFVYPCMQLQQKGLSFKPVCSLGGAQVKDSNIMDSGTTYDEAFADVLSDNVRVPLMLYLLQNGASALTYGLMKTTGCSDSLQAIKGDLISTHIPQALRKQAFDFHEQCYLEAKSEYLNKPLNQAEQEKAKEIMTNYGGEDDLNWMGSKVLQTFYYGRLKAKSPVAGFSYADYPSSHFAEAAKEDKAVANHLPDSGYPTCDAWWLTIRNELVETSNRASWYDEHLGQWNVERRVGQYQLKHKLGWGSQISSSDFIARVLLEGDGLQVGASEALFNENNGAFGTAASRTLVNSGQWIKSWSTTPLKREATMQSLPIMQAFFMFFLIVLTPFVLALSGYSLRAVCSICALMFMGIFIQYLWHLAGFLERAMVNSLGENNVVSAMQNIMLLFYFIAPIVLLKLSSHFGGEGGAVLSSLMDSSQNVADEKTKTAEGLVRTPASFATLGLIGKKG
ncbi:conjugal transfer protein TraG N-terminal domain-containing protein [Legionella fairfieldensis]|uniref:conjugal transfer protein TraG N-terminal domain-containing protein n=1 Tax=Legionella fairfieldensis TaxID=45064 RepID=UPI00048A4663|nr:conjugal transfer protein TraG N-terminal domain-containing protein [Legionella fairfieldensis]